VGVFELVSKQIANDTLVELVTKARGIKAENFQ
jgi:hypothetical protein